GKAILVTGGGGDGVGRGVCDAVVAAGGFLLVNDLTKDRAEAAAARYDNAVPLPGDVSSSEDVERMFQAAARNCYHVAGLVNSAGVGLSRAAHEVEERDFDRLYNVDLRAVWLVSRAFLRQALKARTPGSIVNISSVNAHATIPRYSLYAGAKGGVEALTRGLAVEYGDFAIRCNAVAPGYVHSEQNVPLLRTLTDDPEAWIEAQTRYHQALPYKIEPIDCGRLVVFLLSDAARCITGQTIRIDCGSTVMLYDKSLCKPADPFDNGH
ncbi:MAG: SDR family NAD(P)-dependent oxidoreductase, partial [Pyrinomonadaceae bacterium]